MGFQSLGNSSILEAPPSTGAFSTHDLVFWGLSLYRSVRQRLQRLLDAGAGHLLGEGSVGLEKEGLRVTPTGDIAHTSHSPALGAPLTHPYITTDYSEALLELITPPRRNKESVLEFLNDIHCFVYDQLGEELLWATSMPCIAGGDEAVPIATYGHSNAGLMKTIYRRGLGLRYGRTMQAIAGVHFNYSLSEKFWPTFQTLEGNTATLQNFVSESYLGMVRNLQRYGWLIPYLFGASPAVCKAFVQGRSTDLQEYDDDTLYYPYATSLRMGDIGYQNSLEEGKGFRANYDSLDAYVRSLTWAIETPCPDYEQIGVVENGEYRQLSTNVLQIENEHYSTIRPKQIPHWLEKPTLALRRRGVRYVELRSLDVNVFEPTGVTVGQLYFLEAFLLFCLLNDSPRISAAEAQVINTNQTLTAHRGREPGLRLQRGDGKLTLREWAGELLSEMAPLVTLLDQAHSATPYKSAMEAALERITHPETTPSARMLAEMRARGESFGEFTLRISRQHRTFFAQWPITAGRQTFFEQLVRISHGRQQALETENDRPFRQFLEDYFAQT